MRRLDLAADPIAALVRARPPRPATIVWVHDEERGVWAVLRAAQMTGVVHTLCLRTFTPSTVAIRTSTQDPRDESRPRNTCPACETELAAATPGAAVGIEPGDIAIARAPTPPLPQESRVPTANLRGARRPASDPPEAWDRPAWDPPSKDAPRPTDRRQ